LLSGRMKKLQDLKEEIRRCKKCRLWKTRRNALPGEGNPNARLMLIAQAPGENEDRERKMFIGPSGKELNRLLQEADVSRKKAYMTNLIKCMLPKYRKPKQDEIQACTQHLNEEILLINPSVIATLGYYPTKYIFVKYQIPLPKFKLEFSKFYSKIFLAQNRKILPLRHPATLLYDGSFREEMVKNYRKLKTLMVDCKWFLACPMKKFYEEGRMDKKWIELYCKGDWKSCVRYHMEERGEPHPDWMLPDGSLDERLRD
jgi:uracil-DNA glycosylase family 4